MTALLVGAFPLRAEPADKSASAGPAVANLENTTLTPMQGRVVHFRSNLDGDRQPSATRLFRQICPSISAKHGRAPHLRHCSGNGTSMTSSGFCSGKGRWAFFPYFLPALRPGFLGLSFWTPFGKRRRLTLSGTAT